VVLFRSGCARNPLMYKFDTCKKLHHVQTTFNHANLMLLNGLLVRNSIIYHVYDNPGASKGRCGKMRP